VTAAPPLPVHMQRNGFDPAPELAELREGKGVTRIRTAFGMDAWIVTRFADVREVLSDPARFSNSRLRDVSRPPGFPPLSPEERSRQIAGNLLAADPPEHTRLRRMLTPEFTVRRMRTLEPRIRDIVDEHLDAMERHGPPADLVAEFALPVPSLVICELLGVPYADRAAFQERSNRQLDLRLPVEDRLRAGRESRAYMAELVARAQADPGEDMLGMLVREHGDDLSTDELVGIASLLLIAGHETTANQINMSLVALCRHPDELARLRDDPETIPGAIEEFMRFVQINGAANIPLARVTKEEVRLGGITIPAGEVMLPLMNAANRDPAAFTDPDRLDVTRAPKNHLGFGAGAHHCLGAQLARMELQETFRGLLGRLPGLRMAMPLEEIEFKPDQTIASMRQLLVTWDDV
jgi:cytochrome P450